MTADMRVFFEAGRAHGKGNRLDLSSCRPTRLGFGVSGGRGGQVSGSRGLGLGFRV